MRYSRYGPPGFHQPSIADKPGTGVPELSATKLVPEIMPFTRPSGIFAAAISRVNCVGTTGKLVSATPPAPGCPGEAPDGNLEPPPGLGTRPASEGRRGPPRRSGSVASSTPFNSAM